MHILCLLSSPLGCVTDVNSRLLIPTPPYPCHNLSRLSNGNSVLPVVQAKIFGVILGSSLSLKPHSQLISKSCQSVLPSNCRKNLASSYHLRLPTLVQITITSHEPDPSSLLNGFASSSPNTTIMFSNVSLTARVMFSKHVLLCHSLASNPPMSSSRSE